MSVQSIAVVGSGLMGRGIAEASAVAGISTTLVKATAGEPDGARAAITASLDRSVQRGRLSAEARDRALDRLRFARAGDLDALGESELILESVIEDLEVKQRLFAELERVVGPHAVLATNTSSLRVLEVGARLVRAERLVGIHFFSPVPAMKLVEIAPTRATAPFAMERAQVLVSALGKTAVVVGDTSGYIVNRLLVPLLLDGIRALEAGVASAADIDTAMKLGCGHPMGPLALADAVGLDVVYAMARTLYLELHEARYSPPPLLRRLVLAGDLGKKSGRGVYDWRHDPAVENPRLSLLPEVAG